MNLSKIKAGLRVCTATKASTNGIQVSAQYLANRRSAATGVVQGHVGGHNGNVWWVEHEDDFSMAPYLFTELEPVE